MNLVLWILQCFLALGFVVSGMLKLIRPGVWLANRAGSWAEDYSDAGLNLIGLAEVLGGIGLVLPWALDVARVLTPVAALGLTALMIGAVATHMKIKDGHFAPAMVLGTLSAVVAWGRLNCWT